MRPSIILILSTGLWQATAAVPTKLNVPRVESRYTGHRLVFRRPAVRVYNLLYSALYKRVPGMFVTCSEASQIKKYYNFLIY